ncbi:MAG: hypothetical protein IKO72_10880 [Kiritimatiellae bacterium]|nr:hypothetical protein [Kiritimatiellia bacterium]
MIRPIVIAGIALYAATSAARPAFEKIALIDNFDFITHFDCETKEGTRQILDRVFMTGADSMAWRHQTGGVVRFPTREEPTYLLNGVVDKRRVPDNRVHGRARLEVGETNLLAYAIAEAKKLGKGAGIHYTMEENHFAAFTFGLWNMEHPQYWTRGISGEPWAGRCSFAFPEVLDHKMRLLDELLDANPDFIYLDPWRRGAWRPGHEYVEPVLAEWKRRFGAEPPPQDPRDQRWLEVVGSFMERYMRAIKARIAAHGGRTRFLLGLADITLADDNMWRDYAIDWKKYAKEGLVDAVVVSNVLPGGGDAWAETRKIYELVMARRGKADVYFHVSTYDYHYGIPSYCRRTGEKPEVVAKKLLDLAHAVGGAGVILECVDYGNYPPAINAILQADAAKGK